MKFSDITGALGHLIRQAVTGKKGKVLPAGVPAPDFTAKDESGNEHTLKQYRGMKLILWFYPRASTPG
jgi:hypothetical protein